MHWTTGLHHDGSALYVSNPLPKLGAYVSIGLRLPLDAPVRKIFIRSAPDGEHHYDEMQPFRNDLRSTFWTGELAIRNPRTSYRFKLLTDEGAYYLNALGVSQSEKPDWLDFKIVADYAAPTWVQGTVFYQIFPDRFHNGDPALTVPAGAWSQEGFTVTHPAWGEAPKPWREAGNLDFYGGDLPGITQKLDYLSELGINGLYLCPVFVSRSNHRYDVENFTEVDPHLGGNAALADLRQALHAADMRLMLDTTPNHISWHHPWFTAAQADPNAPTAEYFTFYDNADYETWMGVRSLAKLNYRSQKLRDAIYRASDSALRFWLRPPYSIDAWRLDVLNMTARQGADQLQQEVGREIRAAVKADTPTLYLIGEHFFDATPHLQGDELDATMNYQGFNIPVRRWLGGYDLGADFQGAQYMDWQPLPTAALAEQMQHFLAAVPWVVALQQFNQLGSHDTVRFLTAVGGNTALLKVGVALLMTFPGVPCIYYGDEVGLQGGGDPDNRRCMPWDEAAWDVDLRDYYRRMIWLRRSSSALQNGGFQILHADGDLLVFQRQSPDQRLIIVVQRGLEALATVTFAVWHSGIEDHSILHDLLSEQTVTVAHGEITLPHMPAAAVYIFEG